MSVIILEDLKGSRVSDFIMPINRGGLFGYKGSFAVAFQS